MFLVLFLMFYFGIAFAVAIGSFLLELYFAMYHEWYPYSCHSVLRDVIFYAIFMGPLWPIMIPGRTLWTLSCVWYKHYDGKLSQWIVSKYKSMFGDVTSRRGW
jgi:hypothetical protein